MKYFLFNKPLDFERGYMENCRLLEDGLSLPEDKGAGIFFSRVLDSREKETLWHRFTQEGESPFGSFVRLHIYGGEIRELTFQGRAVDVEEIIRDPELSSQEKMEAFFPFRQAVFLNPEDELLFDVKGRYLWFAAELSSGQEEKPRLKNMTFYFPKETWMKHLPGVYGNDRESADFLERYLGIFQTVYEDMEREIRQDAAYLEPRVTDKAFLHRIARWMDMGNTSMWSDARLRRLMEAAPRLLRLRGTKRGLSEIISIYTGEEPIIVEEWQTREYGQDGERRKQLEELYGRDPNMFTILIKEEYMSSASDYQAILSLIREEAPAYMEVNIVPLKPWIFLGRYSYLGINSRLEHYKALKLDGLSALTLTVIGEGLEEGERLSS